MKWLRKLIEWIAKILASAPVSSVPKLAVPEIITPKSKLDIAIPLVDARAWKGIVIHHSASPDGQTRDWEGIVKYHMSYRIDFEVVTKEEFERRLAAHEGKVFQKPWLDVGYHAGIEFVNGEPTLHWGRPLSMVGAHAGVEGVSNAFNETYIGICCIGNYDLAPPDPKIWDFNLMVTHALMEAFHIPKTEVIGHREVFDRLGVPRQKTCPGSKWSMENYRSRL